MDATDAMTSQTVEARHSYQAADIVLTGDQDKGLIRRLPNGQLAVDYTCFRTRTAGAVTVQEAVEDIAEPEPALMAMSPQASPAATPMASAPLARLRTAMQTSPSADVSGADPWGHSDLAAVEPHVSAAAAELAATAQPTRSGGSAGVLEEGTGQAASPVHATRLRLQRFSVPPRLDTVNTLPARPGPLTPTRPSPLNRRALPQPLLACPPGPHQPGTSVSS